MSGEINDFPGLFNSSLAPEKSCISSDWCIKIRAKETHNKDTYCCSQGPLKKKNNSCILYTYPRPRDVDENRMPYSA